VDSGRPLAFVAAFGSAVCAGLFLATLTAPGMLGELSEHAYWYLGRSSGFVAYWLLFLSVVLGLAVSSRVFDGMLARPWVFELHKFLSIFVLIAMAFHALIMLPDPWAGFSVKELLVPFASHYRNTAVGIGQLVFYGSVLVSVSFYLKGIVGQNGWRWLHYSTFVLFVGAVCHGVWAGTDSGRTVVEFSYLGSGLAVLFLTFFRVLATRAAGGKPRPSTEAAPRVRPPISREAANPS
jgi:predicted ferric reductase